jgi:hypothetical protein
MARSPKASGSQDLIGRISDTITNHSRLSAAAAFQMGVLLGQVMHNTGALKGIGRTVEAAPGAIASSIPTFGLFESKSAVASRRRRGRAKPAARRSAAKRAPARAAKRRKRAARG